VNDTVHIVEMGARDGLQNERTPVSPAERIAFIKKLLDAGLHTIEVGAFVSPRAIPQMVGSDEVLRGVNDLPGEFHVLVPNEKGYETARACGAKVISVFTAASEGFCRANINCSIAESIERFKPVVERAKSDGIRVRGYVSTVLGCPFDGEVALNAVADVAKTLWDLGCYEISLGDTIGVGTPVKAKAMLRAVGTHVPKANLAMHFHDTYGQALAKSVCGNGRGRARHRFRSRRSRRLSVRAWRHRQCRDRGCRLHARGHGHQNRCRHGQARRRHQRDHRADRAQSGEPGRECVECDEANSE
jgi:hydroxymethylglutaryl-CoA lyase